MSDTGKNGLLWGVRMSALTGTAVWAALALTLSAPAAAQTPTTAADDLEPEAEETRTGDQIITVTARKRVEEAQDVPMSISAIEGEQLERLGGDTLGNIGGLFPGVSFNDSNGQGGEFSIRGLTSGGSGSDTSIGQYVDEVFVGDEGTLGNRLYDLETIQILRGPQGTLLGRNTVAGAVNIVTRKPTPELGGAVDATYGTYDLRQLAATLNVPLAGDRLMMRGNFIYRERDGYLRNTAQPGVRGNDENGYGYRVHLLAKPTERLDLLLSVDGSRDRTCNNMFKIIGGLLFAGNTDPDESAWDGPCEGSRDVFGISGRADYDLGSATFTSITAYRDRQSTLLTDRDFTGLPIAATGGDSDEQVFTQEFRVASKGNEQVNWLVGAFYFNRNYFQDTIIDLGPGFLGPGRRNIVHALADSDIESFAGFGSVEYWLMPTLAAEFGLRYTFEKKMMDYQQTATFPIPGFGVVPPFSKEVDGGKFSPSLSVSQHWTDDQMTYARIARGFKSGGFNSGPSSNPARIEFTPETVTSYEIGHKAVFDNRRGSFDGTIYYIDYKDIQQSDQDGAGFYISNAAAARSYGVETQFSYRPIKNLLLNAGLGYVNAKYTDFGTRSGNSLPRAPKWTGSASFDYTIPLASSVSAFIRPELIYRSSNFVDNNNTPLYKQGSYAELAFRAGVTSEDGWSIVAWMRNATNNRYLLSGFDIVPIGQYVTYAAPRTYGVDLRWAF